MGKYELFSGQSDSAKVDLGKGDTAVVVGSTRGLGRLQAW